MANKIYNEEYIRDIANAIREKNNTTNKYKVSEMGDAIRAIPSIIQDITQEDIIDEINEQIVLITEIQNTLDGKSILEEQNKITKSIVERTIISLTADDLNGIEKIGNCAFYQCSSLQSIIIPDSVKNIEASALSSCSNLNYVEIGTGIEEIQEWSFYGCSKLSTIIIRANTPPVLTSTNAIPTTITIKVPESAINTYRTTNNWSAYNIEKI